MSVDLHRIGTGISSGTSRNGFGNIVSFPSVSFPAYGTMYLSGQIEPYEGGIAVEELSGEVLYLRYATYDLLHDGAGGTFTSNYQIQTYPYGTPLLCPAHGGSNPYPYAILVANTTLGYDFGYTLDGTYRNFLADGNDGYYVTMHTASYFANNTYIGNFGSQETEVYWDGNGGYFPNP